MTLLVIIITLLSFTNLFNTLDKTSKSNNVGLPVNARLHLFVRVGAAENHLNWSFERQSSSYSDFNYVYTLPNRSEVTSKSENW